MSHPGGVNLLDNTSVLALGIPLAPVTWVVGPVASMNVALTLAPALSALAMFLLLWSINLIGDRLRQRFDIREGLL